MTGEESQAGQDWVRGLKAEFTWAKVTERRWCQRRYFFRDEIRQDLNQRLMENFWNALTRYVT